MKISIIGPSAGGKSVLARKLCEKFSLPMLELDRLWFRHGGTNVNTIEQKQEINKKIRADIEQFVISNDNWVTEGTYSKIQLFIANKADTVILIKRPLLSRMFSHVLRVIKGKDRHPEVTKWQDLCFARTIFRRWRNGENKSIEELVGQFKGKTVVLKSFQDIDRYFDSLL